MKVHKHRDRSPARYWTAENSHPAVLPDILASNAGFVLFVIIAEAVVHLDRITQWDVRALQWRHSGSSPLGIEFFTALSLFGTPLFLASLGLIVAVFLIRKQQWNYFAGWCVAQTDLETLETQRPRPENAAPSLVHFRYSLTERSCHAPHDRLHHALVCSGDSLEAGPYLVNWHCRDRNVFNDRNWIQHAYHDIRDVVAGFAARTSWVFLCSSVTIFRPNRSNAGQERTP